MLVVWFWNVTSTAQQNMAATKDLPLERLCKSDFPLKVMQKAMSQTPSHKLMKVCVKIKPFLALPPPLFCLEGCLRSSLVWCISNFLKLLCSREGLFITSICPSASSILLLKKLFFSDVNTIHVLVENRYSSCFCFDKKAKQSNLFSQNKLAPLSWSS